MEEVEAEEERSRHGPGLQPVRKSPPGAGRAGMRLPGRLALLRSTPLAARPPGRVRTGRAAARRGFSRGRLGSTMAEEAKKRAAFAAVDKHVQVRQPGVLRGAGGSEPRSAGRPRGARSAWSAGQPRGARSLRERGRTRSARRGSGLQGPPLHRAAAECWGPPMHRVAAGCWGPPMHAVAMECMEWLQGDGTNSGLPGPPVHGAAPGCRDRICCAGTPQCTERPWGARSGSGVHGAPSTLKNPGVQGQTPGYRDPPMHEGPRGAWRLPVHRRSLGCTERLRGAESPRPIPGRSSGCTEQLWGAETSP